MQNETPTPTKPAARLTIAEIVAKAADPVKAIQDLGAALAKSQMMGPTDRVEIGTVLVMVCATEGLTVPELFRTYQLVFGRLEKRTDAAVAEFISKGGSIEWIKDGSDGIEARARFKLGAETIEAGCTLAEAQKAGWAEKNAKWRSEPQTMLRARVKKRGVLALAPSIFYGEYGDLEDGGSVPLNQQPTATLPQAVGRATRPALEQTAAPAPATPSAPTTPAPAPAPAPAAQSSAAPGESFPTLSEELQTKLVEIIGGDKVAFAEEWLREVAKWLHADMGIDQLPEKFARQIIAKPDAFKAKLNEFIAKKGGAK